MRRAPSAHRARAAADALARWRRGRGGHRAHLLELLVGGDLDLRHDAVLELVPLGLVVPELELGRILRVAPALCHPRSRNRARAASPRAAGPPRTPRAREPRARAPGAGRRPAAAHARTHTRALTARALGPLLERLQLLPPRLCLVHPSRQPLPAVSHERNTF